MLQPQAGTWYIVVTCDGCDSTIFLFPDLNEGNGSLDAHYLVRCPRCKHKGAYDARHYFHAQTEKVDDVSERRSRIATQQPGPPV